MLKMKLGSKFWWLKQIETQNIPYHHLDVSEDPSHEQYPPQFLAIKANPNHTVWSGDASEEKILKEAFLDINLFDQQLVRREETIKLGNHIGRIDVLASGFDNSQWAVEFKIVEEKRDIGERKMPINILKISEAIGQALLYSAAYHKKYPSQHFKVMPVVCTWLLGGGSSEVVELCKNLGVTMINLEPDRKTVRIYRLDDEDPRLFT